MIALTLVGAACSDDSDSSDGDSITTSTAADDDAGEDDEPDDDAGTDHEDGDDDGSDEPVNNAGGPPPANELRLGGSGGTVVVTVDCIDPPTGLVLFSLEGGEAGTSVTVAVNTQTAPLEVQADGTGSQGIQTEVTDPSAITVDFGDSKQAGRLIGC